MATLDIDELQDYFWIMLLGQGHCASYDGAIDLDILNVLEYLEPTPEEFFFTKMAVALKIDEKYVQLIQYLLCGADFAEYGTSPRGCWLTDKGRAFIQKMKPYHDYLRSPQ